MSIINYHDPTVINWNLDDNGRLVSSVVLNETKQVVDGKIPLEGLPDEQYRIQITGYVEINIKDKIDAPNKFKCDYTHGVLYFDQSKNGVSININKYYSRGQFYIPSSRIWTKVDDLGNVVSTLADMEGDLGEMASQIDAISAMAENASGIKTSLETNITLGTTLNTNLQTNISTATTKKTQLDGSISTSTTSKSNLDTSISNANTSKSNLDTSIGNAATSKSNLDSSISSGSTLKTNLDGSIATGTTLKSNLDANITTGNQLKVDLPPLISGAGTAKTNLDGSITTSITKKADLDGSINSATTKKTDLDASITSANTINNTLSNTTTGTIKKATDINTTLNTSIGTANTSKSNLDTSVGIANTSKTNLDGSVVIANTSKSNLDNSVTSANTKKSELDTSISSANTINNTLANPTIGNIKKATDINLTLSGNISTATTKSNDLQSTITNANTSRDNLDISISNSATAKSNLDGSISTANTAKTGLDGSIVIGNDLKGELDDIISGTDYEQVMIDVNSMKQDQHNHTNKNTLDGLSDVSGKLKYNGQDVGVGDMEKSVYDIDGDGKVDVANNSEKLGGQLPSYYAKQSDVNNKVDKVAGKQLSTEDYTTTEKNKLTGIATNATKNDTDANLKSRANHTGTQLSSTISDFSGTVRATVLTGLSTATNAIVNATDTVLSAIGKLQKQITDNLSTLTGHTGDSSNPHSVTKTQIGLSNVENTSDISKPVSTATQTALNGKVDNSRVLSDVPLGAKFTDTVTTINGKTGEISKADIVALGIPASNTDTTYGVATTSTDGLMSSTDKTNVNENTTTRHSHTNKITLDGLSDVSGKLKYNGQDVGVGDMEKSTYDKDGDGKVDITNNSEKLGGQSPDYYLSGVITWGDFTKHLV